MKKLVLTFAAIGLFFTGTQAQEVAEAQTENPAQMETVTVAEDDYEQITIAQIPAAVNEAITRDFAGAVTQEAWVKEKDDKRVYKLKLNVNGEEKKVYADAQGNWIDKDAKKKAKKKDS